MNNSSLNNHSGLTSPETWVHEHGDALYRFAIQRVGQREVAEDLVQETFLAALRANTYSLHSSERTWFIGVLKHKIIDYLRKHSRDQKSRQVLEDEAADPFDETGRWRNAPNRWFAGSSRTIEREEFWEVLRRCLDDLPSRLRAVFTLRELDELPMSELRRDLDISAGNLSVLLYRARMGLRRCLEVHWFGHAEQEE
ncbi:MAG TPA: sigma-70 family RNA polymerase sigma factor [Pirellulaceae bacterium]|nr:sigma-70 family RNA polymerase sigma factor [Pirellulaceae bacterium]HMO94057.1 sigma-70 family RNA polymerase sigma factor [Pirellulaceae bacterium]HMP70937.1 sigma-70 family RNA polymerase sigma factor [Pirellulaceae bacterium]